MLMLFQVVSLIFNEYLFILFYPHRTTKPTTITPTTTTTTTSSPSTVSETSPTTPQKDATKSQRIINDLLNTPATGFSSDFNVSDPTMLAEFDAAWEELKKSLKRTSGPSLLRR